MALQKHWNVNTFFFKGERDWRDKLEHQQEFNNHKATDERNKCLFLKSLMTDLGIEKKDDLAVKKALTPNHGKAIYNKYKLLFRDRSKKDMALTTQQECEALVVRIYRKMFGNDIVTSKRVTVNKVKIQQHSLSRECLDNHRDIAVYKNEGLIREGVLDLTFGNEHELVDHSQPIVALGVVLRELKRLHGQ